MILLCHFSCLSWFLAFVNGIPYHRVLPFQLRFPFIVCARSRRGVAERDFDNDDDKRPAMPTVTLTETTTTRKRNSTASVTSTRSRISQASTSRSKTSSITSHQRSSRSRSPNATPVPFPGSANKRLSSSIPQSAQKYLATATKRPDSVPLTISRTNTVMPALSPSPPVHATTTSAQAAAPRGGKTPSVASSFRTRHLSTASTKGAPASTPSRPFGRTKSTPSHPPVSLNANIMNMSSSMTNASNRTGKSTPSKKSTPTKTSVRKPAARQSSSPTASGLPGVPWSPQGALTKESASLLSDSPASLEKKFRASVSPHISFNGDASIWGDEDNMSFDMVTETDDGAGADEDVRP